MVQVGMTERDAALFEQFKQQMRQQQAEQSESIAEEMSVSHSSQNQFEGGQHEDFGFEQPGFRIFPPKGVAISSIREEFGTPSDRSRCSDHAPPMKMLTREQRRNQKFE